MSTVLLSNERYLAKRKGKQTAIHMCSDNKFIPITNTCRKLFKKADAYLKPCMPMSYRLTPSKKYDEIIRTYKTGGVGFRHEGTGLIIDKGVIYDQDSQILVLTTVESGRERDDVTYLDNKNVHIFVNSAIIDTTEYKAFYRKIKEKILTPIIEEGGEVHICSETTIDRNCFVPVKDYKPKLNSIAAMEKYILNIKGLFFQDSIKAKEHTVLNCGNFNLIEDV